MCDTFIPDRPRRVPTSSLLGKHELIWSERPIFFFSTFQPALFILALELSRDLRAIEYTHAARSPGELP
jgi:hypothetical protein